MSERILSVPPDPDARDPFDWHNKPLDDKGKGPDRRCLICGYPAGCHGEHRKVRDDEPIDARFLRRVWHRADAADDQQPHVSFDEVIVITREGRRVNPQIPATRKTLFMLAKAAALSASGKSYPEIGKILGVSRAAVEQWAYRYRAAWQAYHDEAMRATCEVVKAQKGSSEVLDDPESFIERAKRAERWATLRRIDLTPDDVPIGKGMLLSELLKVHFLDRDVSKGYRSQLRWSLRMFERFAGKPLTVGELSEELVNRWIVSMQATQKSTWTIKSQRGNILTLWRCAWRHRLTDELPRNIRYVKPAPLVPKSWSPAEVGHLLECCDRLEGYCQWTGAKLSRLWRAFIMTGWDTALRLGDLFSLERSMIRDDGVFVMVQGKTGFPIKCRLRPETLAAIDSTNIAERELLFPWRDHPKTFFWNYKKLLKFAGLRGGIGKMMRSSSATAVEGQLPGAAMSQLGHKTHGLAYRHYVNPTELPFSRPMPPALVGPSH